MPPIRLSALDTSFLTAETPTAHMHVGWAAVFDPPSGAARPSFADLCDHVESRLHRAPRYRQRLATVPLDVHDPEWVDDAGFDITRHVLHSPARELRDVVDAAMSSPLERSRPLWEMWIADHLDDGRIAVVGKAHHCMVDGIAAVELGSLLLDAEPDPPAPPAPPWVPALPPGPLSLLARAVAARVSDQLAVLGVPANVVRAPRRRLAELAGEARRAALALGHALGEPAPPSPFNEPGSPLRHLATVSRPIDDLREIKERHGVTLNDVVLAVSAGGVRRFLHRGGDDAVPLKAMVPVSVRGGSAAADLGNRISFVFITLPCDEPDAVQRLRAVSSVMNARKRTGEPQGTESVLKLVAHSPRWIQRAMTGMVASPRSFNLVVSNIPGPGGPLYMRGCPLREAYPIVPLAERHALAIGVTTVAGRACFGLYADRKALPDADRLAADVDAAIGELLARPGGDGRREHPRLHLTSEDFVPA